MTPHDDDRAYWWTTAAAAACSVAALLATPDPVSAQTITPVGLLIPQVSVLSDYRYNGVSNSDRKPSVRASAYLWRPDGLYAGAELTRVRFNDGRGTDVELVAYAGRNFDVGKTRLALEGMAIIFPDQGCCGPKYDFNQLTAKASRGFGPLTLGANASWTPEASYAGGPAWRLTGEASYRLASWATVGGRLGRYESLRRQDRTYWDIGVTLKRQRLSLDLRYADTNLSRPQCFYTDWCEASVVTALTYTLPSLRK
jgi:uncharacterized protein (TIGR02001 family)